MVLSPPDGEAAAALIRATVNHPGPIYIRLGRGREPSVYSEAPAVMRREIRTCCAKVAM